MRNARCGCINWYRSDVTLDPVPAEDPCPCTLNQAQFDWTFIESVDFWFYIVNREWVDSNDVRTVTDAQYEEWNYDVGPSNVFLIFW